MIKKVFKSEFNWLQDNLPGALDSSSIYLEPLVTLINILSQNNSHFEDSKLFGVESPINNTSITDSMDSIEVLIENLIEIFDDSGVEVKSNLLSNLIADLGRDAFGVYLPMHAFYNSSQTPWGIYLFPDLIFSHADNLHKEYGSRIGLSLKQTRYAFCYAVYRHEMFHHQVERFATKLEIWNKNVIYKKYNREVYTRTANSEDWLEEALAEDSVLSSYHIINKVKIPFSSFKDLYKYDLNRMPPGYKDYHCRKFGGPANARRIFASQIAQCRIDISTQEMVTPSGTVNSNENGIRFGAVPVYTVSYDHLKRIKGPEELLQKY